jgi:hypothetical protein
MTHPVIEEWAREANRVQKILETASIKLGDVATDVLGVSGRAMIEALIAGDRPRGSSTSGAAQAVTRSSSPTAAIA